MTAAAKLDKRELTILQISDTHVSADMDEPTQWGALRNWLSQHEVDAIVHSGDVVLEDPDNAEDRLAARATLELLDRELLMIPGNHDVGFYDEPAEIDRRVTTFQNFWGHDRFRHDLGSWRLIGINAYLLGHGSAIGDEHQRWFVEALETAKPIVVFVHQPPTGDVEDAWAMPTRSTEAFLAAVQGRPVALVTSGHRHCHVIRRDGPFVAAWSPSLVFNGGYSAEWLIAQGEVDIDPSPGALVIRLTADGHAEVEPLRF